MCQEVAHTLGLDHQDENFSNPNLGTCMDYTNSPDSNQHPNAHDYDMLEQIYAHLDSAAWATPSRGNSGNSGATVDASNPSEWGKSIRESAGRSSLYARDFGNGEKLFTFVIWANQ